MIPIYRPGEVVTIHELDDDHPEADRWILDEEGVIAELQYPTADGERWCYSVWVEDRATGDRSLRVLDEEQFESVGSVEDEDGRRKPLGQVAAPVELRNSIQLRLVTNITEQPLAERAAQEIAERLESMFDSRKLETALTRHDGEPFNYELHATVEPRSDSLGAFDSLMNACDESGLESWDDGWSCEFAWQKSDLDGAFLDPAVESAKVSLSPWDSRRRRPESDRRGSAPSLSPTA